MRRNLKRKKRTKNIAIIVNSLSTGGAEKVAAMLSVHLFEQGKNVYLMLDDYDRKKSYQHRGKIARMFHPNTGNPWLDLLYKSKDLKNKKELYKIDCSISFIEDNNFVNVLSSIGELIIVSVHTYLTDRMNEWSKDAFRYRVLIPLLYNWADHVIALTNAGKEDLHRNFYISKRKISIIQNAVDKDSLNAKKDIELSENAILMIGRLEEVKAYWYAILAMKKVLVKNESIHLYILGKGKLLKKLQQLACECGIEKNIHFLGFHSNVGDYLRCAKLFLLTSIVEGFSNVVIEALSSNTAVLCTDCVGPREILNPKQKDKKKIENTVYGEFGILVPCIAKPQEREIEILASAILNLIKNDSLREYYEHIAEKRAKDFEQTLIYKKWDKLINI